MGSRERARRAKTPDRRMKATMKRTSAPELPPPSSGVGEVGRRRGGATVREGVAASVAMVSAAAASARSESGRAMLQARGDRAREGGTEHAKRWKSDIYASNMRKKVGRWRNDWRIRTAANRTQIFRRLRTSQEDPRSPPRSSMESPPIQVHSLSFRLPAAMGPES